eukprot:TRINITY_DN1863_c0_g1_i1.p1 TRINITY_DN1863_c0_g1~~TRINITY_DN1863_c0_g1_i1.p1  ORF type:complete len:148 (+),score=28.10 TRINITY_DN1863_c0_g1_i1:62-445(+)
MRALLYVSLLVVAHSIFSAVQAISEQKTLGIENRSMPLDISLECIVGCLLSGFCYLKTCGDFEPISIIEQLSSRPYESYEHRPNFVLFNQKNALPSNSESKRPAAVARGEKSAAPEAPSRGDKKKST